MEALNVVAEPVGLIASPGPGGGLCLAAGKGAAVMKIALLGTGFGQAHAAVYAQRPDVDEVVVFGRTRASSPRSAASSGSPPPPIWTG